MFLPVPRTGLRTFINNGNTYQTEKGQLVGGLYGLIDYNCDNVTGAVVSKLDCQKCRLYCWENELIEGCQQVLLPVMIGLYIGMIFFIESKLSSHQF